MQLEISPLRKEDLILLPALQPEGWYNIIPPHELYLNSTCSFPLKFTENDNLIGIGTTIIHNDSAWLGHIIVHPGLRKMGVGRMITTTLMDVALSKHCDLLSLIATDLGEPVYAKLGFEIETEYVFFKEVNPSADFTPRDTIVKFQPLHLADLLAFDKRISGENRAVYLQENLNGCILYLMNDRIEGVYLPAAGEGMIIASTPSAGTALLEFRTQTKDACVFPLDNVHALQYFEKNKHKPFRTAKRMIFGKKRTWHPEFIYNRIGGNLG